MNEDLGQQFVRALAQKDASALKALLRPDVDFRALTPGRVWEASSSDAVVDEIVFGTWFEAQRRITAIISIDTGTIGLRQRVGYQLSVSFPEGDHIVEQQAYFDSDNGQISWLRVMCSGFQKVGSA
jgi:hypothetical protein